MIKGIVFDFDGLIIDTESLWFEAYKEVMGYYQCELTLEQFSKVIGTTDEALHVFFEKTTGVTFVEVDIEGKTYALFQEKAGALELREGVRDYLEEAKRLGLKIGLASSSGREWIMAYLRKFRIHHYFDVMKTKEDVEKVKPDPALYQQALIDLGIQPSESIAFEDSLNGSLAASTTGMHCVVVPNPVTASLQFSEDHLRLSSMAEKSLSQVIMEVESKKSFSRP
ncbi:HAD family hydrolase [Bacillus sp. FJAT-18017]|uniref:HAD family hydrolase n=1 Tax=Bacillus sp. FJAT-18017 TaxID=1705566 RepID=UPI000AC75FF1|nr:HAD family hydrolase [Bacillus sp. FJAT-18017]